MAKLIKKSKRKIAQRRGNPPKRSVYPKMKIVAEFFYDDRDYDLWHTKSQFGWDNFKLVCQQRSRKSNYWFGWNGEEHRITSMGDHAKLAEHYIGLYDAVERFLIKNYSKKELDNDD